MRNKTLGLAALDSLLISPAAIFMAALVIRNLPIDEVANSAERIVTWFSGRMWTLWVLLLALPFTVLITGCMALFRDGVAIAAARQPLALIRAQPGGFLIAALVLSATIILAIVILHMAAN